MKTEQEYIKDITEIRSMMERSTKFLSLTGMSGVMAGVYALIGAYLAYEFFYEDTNRLLHSALVLQESTGSLAKLALLAIVVLLLAVGTAILLSSRKAKKNGEKLWNAAARRVVANMAIPLVTGGIFILILFSKGLFGLAGPSTLIFYGLALINASKFTYDEVRSLGMIEILLGLLAAYLVGYALVLWAIGFGVMHIAYGIYMHQKYEK